MTPFLTVKEAARHIGRSTSTVRRIIDPIKKDDQHPDRHHIQPGPEEAKELRICGENFAWRVSQELLDQRVPAGSVTDDIPTTPSRTASADPMLRELVTMLRDQVQQNQEQLKVKDLQIASLTGITNNLNERLREGNILIGSLQRQLSLPSGDKRAAVTSTEAARPASPTPKPSAKPAPTKPPKPAVKKPEKRGFFARLFG